MGRGRSQLITTSTSNEPLKSVPTLNPKKGNKGIRSCAEYVAMEEFTLGDAAAKGRSQKRLRELRQQKHGRGAQASGELRGQEQSQGVPCATRHRGACVAATIH